MKKRNKMGGFVKHIITFNKSLINSIIQEHKYEMTLKYIEVQNTTAQEHIQFTV